MRTSFSLKVCNSATIIRMAEGMGSCGAAKADIALNHLREAGVRASFLPVDVTSKTDCETLVAGTEAEFGRLDILVNNAGILLRDQPQDVSEEDWRRVLDTNLTGAFLCNQAA